MTDPATAQALEDYRGILRIRQFEERVRELRLAGGIVGSVHLCIGQEAGPVGACSALDEQDALFATYRGHGWAIARGVPLEPLFAELLGRQTGICGGRGGSAYFSAVDHGFHGENSIVGAGAPIAVGAALAGRYDGTNRVAVTVFGDGAINQGAVHEAMNFAAAFSLPVIFVCENNAWSELTPIEEMVAEPMLWKRAAGYGMPGYRLDGNDPSTVRTYMQDAVRSAREGEGPMLLELITARLVGHYIGDAEQYRRPGELEQARQNEPVARLRQGLGTRGVADAEIESLHLEVAAEIAAACAAALAAPSADPSTAREHIYA